MFAVHRKLYPKTATLQVLLPFDASDMRPGLALQEHFTLATSHTSCRICFPISVLPRPITSSTPGKCSFTMCELCLPQLHCTFQGLLVSHAVNRAFCSNLEYFIIMVGSHLSLQRETGSSSSENRVLAARGKIPVCTLGEVHTFTYTL